MTISSDLISEKERLFRVFQVWPIATRFDSNSWRENFTDSEMHFADRLLDRFTYFPDPMVRALLRAAIQRYLNHAGRTARMTTADCLFTNVEGEMPNPTDSGYGFLRKVRDDIKIPESQICSPREALERLTSSSAYHSLIFVDDFVGSGNQMRDTWKRRHQLTSGRTTSFADLALARTTKFAYCPCICTSYGFGRLKRSAPNLAVFPAHVLSPFHNAAHEQSSVWEGLDAQTAVRFLKEAALRAGYSAEDGGQDDWRGFHRLGLSLALGDTIPDACLPIFFSQRNDWKPLMVRSA